MQKKRSRIKRFLLVVSLFFISLLIAMIGFFTYIYNRYDLDTNKLTSLNNGIKVYSADGNDTSLHNTNRSIIEIETLPDHVKNAFISIEDKRFYSHHGYDLRRIFKSMLINISNKSKSQGASTISQQLIKNALLSNDKTYSRKIQEIVLSIKMEKAFSKDEILEMYLNTIYFGSNAYGIENASRTYFNKSAKDLSLNEACCLAGLIKSPGHYSPTSNYTSCVERKNLVAKSMLNLGYIGHKEYADVISSNIAITNSVEDEDSYEKEAILEACRLLNTTERDLINKKYQIITFKQEDVQGKVIEVNNETIQTVEDKTNRSLDSLTVVTNNYGHVLAYYSNSNYNLHNLKRQPASTLKPFAVYLPCFKHNILSPASQILDEEINYNGFSPKNADNKYHGYVSCRNALSQSLNVPTVKALDYLGVKKSKLTLEDLGINITNADMNLSLALGALKNGVNVMDLLKAYVTLSNQGNSYDLCFVNKILDEKGNTIYSHENYYNPVVDAASCFLVNDILKDCATNGTAKRLAQLNLPVASKTGTASNANGNTDLYNIAYTTEHSILTWIADIDKQTLPTTLLSSSQPTDINKEVLSHLYANHTPDDFIQPSNVVRSGIDIIELESNHALYKPAKETERYIYYDYFKTDNLPPSAPVHGQLQFKLDLNKGGVNISYNAKRNSIYNLCKKIAGNVEIINQTTETNGNIEIWDKNIFSFNEIEYYITDENNKIISDIKKIKPKDYLINLFNNEIFNSKKKWLV